MKIYSSRIFAAAMMLIATPTLTTAQEHRDWEDPQVIGINKLPYHSTLQLPSQQGGCKEIHSLNGKWSFHWSKDPWSRPEDFYKSDYDVSKWAKINVPGNWQLQGFGKPIYTNIPYPFKPDQPRVTSEPPKDWFAYENRNPVGSYVTEFEVTSAMMEKNLILHFEGVHSAFYVWVNGEKVGYSQNPMSPAEFDVSRFVKEGKNRLAVEVYRWSDGSYLEDQDMWRLSGIYRSVELWERPLAHIADYEVKAELADDYSQATVRAKVKVCNTGAKAVKKQQVTLNIDGQRVVKLIPRIDKGDTIEVELVSTIAKPKLWSAEKPNLYDYSVALSDKKGTEQERFDYHLGVRRIEIVGEVFKINGKNVKLRGVNRHDHHPRTGRYVDSATLEKDIALMKQANINMLRTSHYPDAPYLYELCDRYGIYVMDEACHESHGYGYANELMGRLPEWEKAHVDRAVSLVQRDKNHPCVVFWSMGNEGSKGNNIRAMREAILALDTTRPPFYDSDPTYSDLYDISYFTPERMRELAKEITDKPVIAREYAHAMGNSMGHFEEYWDVIYADSTIAGAAIWDFVDQGIAKPFDSSKSITQSSKLTLEPDEFWAFGGDFGDKPNDANFVLNGIVGPDRTPHPHYYEVQHVYRPVDFKLDSNGNVEKINRDFFTDLDEYDYTTETVGEGGEELLNVYAKLREDKPWAKKGFVVAKKQFVKKEYAFPTDIKATTQTPAIKKTNEGIRLTAKSVAIVIDSRGALSEWTVNGQNQIVAPLEPYFWKAFNDNQIASHLPERTSSWKNAADTREVKSIDSSAKNGIATVTVRFSLAVGAEYTLTYSLNNDGELKVTADYQPTAENIELIPKFGMRMRLPVDYQTVEYYGRGPWENYPDRKRSAFIGRYKMPLADVMTEYIHPQDNGNRSDVRWMELSSASSTIRIEGCQPLCIRAWDYGEEDVTVRHRHELQRGKFINLNIDLNIHGVAGTDAWGQCALPQYTIDGNKPYHYSFILKAK